jgi:hypothetical protein
MSGETWKGSQVEFAYDYDFANDGGAIGTIKMGDLPDDFVVTEMHLYIKETITSAGTPTVEVGNDGAGADANGYFADFFGTPTAGTALKGGGALISGGVHAVVAANDGVQITIGTAAVTAGAFRVFVRGYQA